MNKEAINLLKGAIIGINSTIARLEKRLEEITPERINKLKKQSNDLQFSLKLLERFDNNEFIDKNIYENAAVTLRDILWNDANEAMQGAMVSDPLCCFGFALNAIQKYKGLEYKRKLFKE